MSASDASTVDNWHRDSSEDKITSTHAAFALPIVPEPARVVPTLTYTPHGASSSAVNDVVGMTRPYAVHGSRHDSYLSLGLEFPPPPYPDVGLPAYSAESSTEPITLAMYLFKYGFVFPPLWVLGVVSLICPLTAPPKFEASKSETERRELVQIIRDAELRWAKRCAWALVALLTAAGFAIAIILGVMHS